MINRTFKLFFLALLFLSGTNAYSQIDEGQTGAWYMYFWNTNIKDGPWGFQGDVQLRNWDVTGDLEQLLIRGGLTYQPSSTNVKLTLGYGNITTGRFGDDDATTSESRIYQEILMPQKVGNLSITHRFRYEQRFVENQDFRTRYRYNLFLNIPLNKKVFEKGTVYLALYNELFINGQRNIGDGNVVQIFDRNRFYSAIGKILKPGLKVQAGIMTQSTDNWTKRQLQFSLHHTF